MPHCGWNRRACATQLLESPGEDTSMATVQVHKTPAQTPTVKDEARGCCIVGGGPAGAMLALLLARRGVRVTLLEMHHDFDREFRGDTVHPSTLEILDQLGLAERVHELRNSKVSAPTLLTTRGPFTPFDLSRLKTKFPYILMVHQKDLLGLLTQEATRYPGFQLLMGANVTELIREDGIVRGVRYQMDDGVHELRALLTVGSDGRFSRVRHLAGIEPVRMSPPMDVLWFRLPHLSEDIDAPGGAFGGIARGYILGGFDRKDYWQALLIITKGSYQSLRAEGIEGLRRHIVEIDPRLAKHVQALTDWHQVSLLSVESSRCPRWYAPGLLLIGDAAHAMSPVGGLGINYAVQDAVVAANLLTKPLLNGCVTTGQLRAIQCKREWPVRIIQYFQAQLQNRVIAPALRAQGQSGLRIPWLVRLLTRIPFLRDVPPRIIALGVARVRVED
jgi:2-polyprenyl-6-methoxyphenol hydroxylase-like FAD-dependent oxidoreductase